MPQGGFWRHWEAALVKGMVTPPEFLSSSVFDPGMNRNQVTVLAAYPITH